MNRILIAVVAFVIWTGLAFAAGWAWRADRADLASAKRDKADVAAVVEAVQDARATEHTQADKMADIGAKHEEDRRDAAGVPDAVVADLRAGVVRLRNDLATCHTDRLSQASAGAVERNATAQLRAEVAGAAIGIGADADAQLRACQAIVKSDRGLAGG